MCDSSVRKALRVFRYMIENNDVYSVREIANNLGIPKSTSYRLLSDLRKEDFIGISEKEKGFILSLEVYRLASLVLQKANYLDVVRTIAEETAEDTGETILFGLYYPTQLMMTIAIMVESKLPLRYAINVGVLQTTLKGASGKGILAWLSQEEIDKIITMASKEGLQVNRLEVLEELSVIRKQGYVISYGERIPGALGISVPIFGMGENVIGCLVATIPQFRSNNQLEKEIINLLICKGKKISAHLGHLDYSL